MTFLEALTKARSQWPVRNITRTRWLQRTVLDWDKRKLIYPSGFETRYTLPNVEDANATDWELAD